MRTRSSSSKTSTAATLRAALRVGEGNDLAGDALRVVNRALELAVLAFTGGEGGWEVWGTRGDGLRGGEGAG